MTRSSRYLNYWHGQVGTWILIIFFFQVTIWANIEKLILYFWRFWFEFQIILHIFHWTFFSFTTFHTDSWENFIFCKALPEFHTFKRFIRMKKLFFFKETIPPNTFFFFSFVEIIWYLILCISDHVYPLLQVVRNLPT